jgi:hypothetical protein
LLTVSAAKSYENVGFADQEDPYLYDVESPMDSTRMLQDTDDATLDNFFSRPLKIHATEWGTGAALYFQIDPWSLYLENPRVSNRMANYNLLRSVLHIKVICNGNGFQYGRAIASYLPYDTRDSLSTNSGAVIQDIVQASQQPHIYIDPTTSMGGEMKLPFFYHKNYVNITASEWSDLGTLTVRSLNTLKHANGASDQVTVSVFAWIEDVSMNVLTSVEPSTMTPQAGTEIEEANSKGFISGPATAIAKLAGLGKLIPPIAPYAIATEQGALAVAGIAKSLGYCRPPMTAEPVHFKPIAQSSLALTTVPDGCAKMTVDDKQELTIDPRIAGVGPADVMSVKSIATRESYLTKFQWLIGTAPETLLWNTRISPVTWAESGSSAFHFPACCMATMPFKYWTGTMKYRFQVVCSTFHKGRLKIVYDPNFLATNEYNTNYVQIIDLAETQDFTIETGNGQDTTLLTHHYPGLDSVTQMYSTTPYASREEGNGVLGIYVVNELTTPNSVANNDIEINVFVSCGDDIEVFVPEDHLQAFVFKPQVGLEVPVTIVDNPGPLDLEVGITCTCCAHRRRLRRQVTVGSLEPIEETPYPAQAGEEIVPDSQNTDEPSAPEHEQSIVVGPTAVDTSLVNKVFTGESIATFRTMLKRYNVHTAIAHADSLNRILYGRFSMFPYLRGNVAGAVDLHSIASPYNFCNTLLLHWVTMAFSGWRGSIRWKILPRGPFASTEKAVYYIQRQHANSTVWNRGQNQQPGFTNPSEAAESVVYEVGNSPSQIKPTSGVQGMVYQHGNINPTCEFEVPYYSNDRFTPGKMQTLTTISASTSQPPEGFDYRIWSDGMTDTTYDFYCATGEDFQVYFFTGLPRMYYEASPPVPA